MSLRGSVHSQARSVGIRLLCCLLALTGCGESCDPKPTEVQVQDAKLAEVASGTMMVATIPLKDDSATGQRDALAKWMADHAEWRISAISQATAGGGDSSLHQVELIVVAYR